MENNKIVIYVDGGVIQGISTTDKNLKVLVVDQDNMTEGNEDWQRFDNLETPNIKTPEELYDEYLEIIQEYVEGFQIETKDHEIPDGLFSFQIFNSLEDTKKTLLLLNDPKWKIIPYFFGDIEHPEYVTSDIIWGTDN